MELLLMSRVKSASPWNSLAQWTHWHHQTSGTGLKERYFRKMRDIECTSTLWIILAPSVGDPGTAHKWISRLEHAALSRGPNFKTGSAFSGWRTPKPETKSERLRCPKQWPAALSGIILKLCHVSILRSPEWALSLIPTELANSQTSASQLFKKFTSSFSGLVILQDWSSGRSPLGRPAPQKAWAAAYTVNPP